MSNEVFTDHYAVVLNRAPFEWSVNEGRLRFFGIPSALLWLNGPSLYREHSAPAGR
jgi:rsbT co-antagonist protein RsbR